MSKTEKIKIDNKYLVRDKNTSDGSQIKYFTNNKWYKIDHHGGEAESEYLASLLLSCTNLSDEEYVNYNKIDINNKNGCVSPNFIKSPDEEFITLYRLYKNVTGRDLATVTTKMDYDDAIMYVIDFVYKQVGLDITTYLSNTFWLDAIILNTDRHFNNYGIIMCNGGYKIAPIFDNGKSLLTGSNIDIDSVSISEAVKNVYSKSFSPTFRQNYEFLRKKCTINLDVEKIKNILQELEATPQKKILEYQLEKLLYSGMMC